MSRVWPKAPTAFPRYQYRHPSQQIARSHLPFSKRESIICVGDGGAAGPVPGGGGATRPLADDAAEGPVAAGGGVASPLADDGAEGPVAGGGRGAAGASGSLARDDAEGAAVANGSAAELLAAGGGGARPVADDNAEGPVAKAASADNAAKDSQTGQTIPLQGEIVDTTRSRMVA
jgi:hypothetical protein